MNILTFYRANLLSGLKPTTHFVALATLLMAVLLLAACGGGGGGSGGSGGGADLDGDGIADSVDVDADGDGLIEIYNVAQLNMMRYNLEGTGLDDGTSDNDNTTGGNSVGCGSGLISNGTRITTCNGYEQMANLDLNDLPDNAMPGSNWEPIGNCRDGTNCDGNTIFSGMFSGNGFTISNLFINITTDRFGVGFFGAIASTAQVRNVHIRGGSITGVTSTTIGGLVGYGQFATISDSSVTLAEISGTTQVGGLAGNAFRATITSSVARVGSISGTANVGGLAGSGTSARIYSSVARVGSISGTGNSVGGLLGRGDDATISSSVATIGSISATSDRVGGLIGNGSGANINSSIATVGSISGTGSIGVGGLVGLGYRGGTTSYSVAVTNNITGASDASNVGALVGDGIAIVEVDTPNANVISSYWDSRVTLIPADGNAFGSGQTTDELQDPVANSDGSFPDGGAAPANIYAEWDNAYCNPSTGEYSATAPNPLGDYVRVWDLGEGDEYPAITCVVNFFSLAAQREAAGRALAGESPLVD